MGVELFIAPQLFPQSETETIMNTFKDNLVLRDDGYQDRRAAPFKTRPQASQSRQSLSQHQSKIRQEGKGKQVWKPNQAKNSGTSFRWKQSSKKNGSKRQRQSAQSTKKTCNETAPEIALTTETSASTFAVQLGGGGALSNKHHGFRREYTLPLFYSRLQDKAALGHNALTQDWSRWRAFYLFPPLWLIPRTIQKLSSYNGQDIMVVPWTPAEPWFQEIQDRAIRWKSLRSFGIPNIGLLNSVDWIAFSF